MLIYPPTHYQHPTLVKRRAWVRGWPGIGNMVRVTLTLNEGRGAGFKMPSVFPPPLNRRGMVGPPPLFPSNPGEEVGRILLQKDLGARRSFSLGGSLGKVSVSACPCVRACVRAWCMCVPVCATIFRFRYFCCASVAPEATATFAGAFVCYYAHPAHLS